MLYFINNSYLLRVWWYRNNIRSKISKIYVCHCCSCRVGHKSFL